ncbi:MAG: exosortase-associated EpsI family protein [Dehalococcoidia bacterium]
MAFVREYSTVIALFILVCIVILLLSIPEMVFSSGVSFIDTELHRSSGDEAYVRTKMDFGSQEHVSAFPTEFGKWKGYDYDPTEWEELLGADVIMLRGYSFPGLYQPLFLLIMQAKTESSFHPPTVCYAAQGYQVQEEGKEQVVVTDASWTEATSSISIPLKKLVVIKESDGEITERRVVLFAYVKGNQYTSDAITMIRAEALAPIDGSYEGIMNVEKDFLALTIPLMFEPAEAEEWNPLAVRLVGSGVGGYFAIALMLFVPMAIIVYPRIKWGRESTEESGPSG